MDLAPLGAQSTSPAASGVPQDAVSCFGRSSVSQGVQDLTGGAGPLQPQCWAAPFPLGRCMTPVGGGLWGTPPAPPAPGRELSPHSSGNASLEPGSSFISAQAMFGAG